ncbi:MAG: hypothetical protein HY699_06120 [Deltaproteobacteria bacterium]|nr:hypothetical protein [Deltaproteobacteria bacterium]
MRVRAERGASAGSAWRGAGFAVAALALTVIACRVALAAPAAVNGRLQYETFGYPDADAAAPSWENFFSATLRGRGELSSTLTWQCEGRAVADDLEWTAGAYSLRNASRRRPYLSLVTAALDYRPTPELRLSAGKQIANWSIFDELQPANLINPRDESDVFRRVEVGVPGVSVHYGSGGIFAELMVVPLAFTPSRLPQGRWNIASTVAGSFGGNYIERQDLPPVQFDETQAGARVGARFGQLEATVIGYAGRDNAATLVPGPIISVIVDGRRVYKAQIISHYPRLRAGGVTASYPLGDRLLLRVESVYYNSPDRGRDDFLHSVAGLEYALDDWRFVLSYLRDDQTIAAPEQVTSKGERRFFQSFIFGEGRYDAGGRLRGQLRGGYDVDGEFVLLQPEISYRLWRTLRLALAAEVIHANRSAYGHNKLSYFDSIRHEDRLGTRLAYDF